ncbi:S1 family peptidase, partial [Treponema sp. R6D11]
MEKMKYKPLLIIIAIMASSLFSCQFFQPYSKPLNAKILNLARNAVFEVVVEKPADEQIEYEEEINWDYVPFHIRNDKYYSIGTAFAVSKTELMTAFHVIDDECDNYFVRDSQKNIYEVDMITGGSKEKDYLIFTVKGKTFDKYFQFERKYNIGDQVFSIGNAYGEGIVIRDGLVLGEIPEEDSGRWNELKSSANVNPGNSGGPLVTPKGKVIALVTARRDNILYSIPVDVILNDDRSVLLYREKRHIYRPLMANTLRNISEIQTSLPDTYTNISRLLREKIAKQYDDSLSTLFKEAPEYLSGANNEYLLHGLLNSQAVCLSSSDLQISYLDPNDNNWKLYAPYYYSYNLDDDGVLYQTKYSYVNLYKINKPKSVSLEKICTDPKYIMDTILQNIRTERDIWYYDEYRILSYGEPISTGIFTDSLGRTWITANWKIGYENEVLIMYILPLPDGLFLMTAKESSASFYMYNLNLQKLCDHVFPVYGAKFDEWEEYFT